MYDIDTNKLSLKDLRLPDFSDEKYDKILEECDREQAEYCKKYGEIEGVLRMLRDSGCLPSKEELEIRRNKEINTIIYRGGRPELMEVYYGVKPRDSTSDPNNLRMKMWSERCQYLFGDNYEKFVFHKPGDPEIVELLLQDALKTGKWQELPDCLQEEYNKRKR